MGEELLARRLPAEWAQGCLLSSGGDKRAPAEFERFVDGNGLRPKLDARLAPVGVASRYCSLRCAPPGPHGDLRPEACRILRSRILRARAPDGWKAKAPMAPSLLRPCESRVPSQVRKPGYGSGNWGAGPRTGESSDVGSGLPRQFTVSPRCGLVFFPREVFRTRHGGGDGCLPR